MSRAAVESVPIIADAYSGLLTAESLRSEDVEDDAGFDRGSVEAYPRNPLTYTATYGDVSFMLWQSRFSWMLHEQLEII